MTGRFETLTRRKLLVRTYRDPVQISCTTSENDETVTGSGLDALKRYDDVSGAGLALGTRVESITNAGSIELSKKAKAAGTSVRTFGSAPLQVDGTGTCELYAPERPLHEVYAIKRLDSFGFVTALDLTDMRIDAETGLIVLPGDYFPKGSLNIELHCCAGYRPPSEVAGDSGDWEQFQDLEMLALRAIQVGFQDFMQQAGRSGDITVLQATQRIQSFRLPDDIRQGLASFRRLW